MRSSFNYRFGLPSPFYDNETGSFSPASLFTLSEPGVWFDPSDLTTLFQDPAGTTPVTAPGNTVGLMLDKSRGLALGAELVTNGDFSAATGWSLGTGWAIGGGVASATTAASGQQINQVQTEYVTGRWYAVTFTVVSISAGGFAGRLEGQLGATRTTPGTFTDYFLYTGGTQNAGVRAIGTTTGSIDNVSVKELPGNHATQATIAARPTYSIEPVGGRRNLLLWSEAINTAAVWTTRSTTATASVLTATAGAGDHDVLQVVAAVTGSMTFSVKLKAGTSNFAWVCLSPTFGLSNYATAVVNLATGAVTKTQASGTVTITGSSVSPVDVDGFYRVSFSVSSGGTGINAIVGITTSATPSIGGYGQVDLTAVGTETIQVKEAQLELGSTATPYQRVTTQHDVTEAGVASLGYLYFDGAGDFMFTSTITPGTDKAQVFAGVRKLSDATAGMLVEFSTNWFSSTGSFAFTAPDGTGAKYGIALKGTDSVYASLATFTAPITNVVAQLYDIAGATVAAEMVGRVNGTAVSLTGISGTGAGTGNFLAYPLFIGSRGNAGPPYTSTSLPFSGHLYSQITRFGPTLDAPTIASTETWVAGKTGFYTPIITGVPTIGVS